GVQVRSVGLIGSVEICTVEVCAVCLVVPRVSVRKRIAIRNKGIAVVCDITAVPVGSPATPSPRLAESCSHKEPGSERNCRGRRNIPAGISWISRYRCPVDVRWAVLRHIDDLRIRRLDDDGFTLSADCLLWSRLEIAGILGVSPQRLNGVHYSVRI